MKPKNILWGLLLLCILTVAPAGSALGGSGVQDLSIRIPCTVCVDTGPLGQVQVRDVIYRNTVESFEVQPGTRVDFAVSPDQNCTVSTLTLNGADVRGELKDGIYSIVVNENAELVARFVKSDPKPDPGPDSPQSSPGPDSPQRPSTGDESHLYFYAVIMLISLAVLAGLILYVKGKKKVR